MAYTAINKPRDHFSPTIHTGNGSTQSITGVGHRPDFLWIKDRGSAYDHKLVDSTRGSTYTLESNEQTAQYNDTNGVTSFDSDGFSLGANANMNDNTASVISWSWKANAGTTSSNTSGATTSTVQANTTAGFSIVKWTGTGSATTLGHGLGVAPEFILVKNYAQVESWQVYHKALGSTHHLVLDTADISRDNASRFNDVDPTSTLFTVGNNDTVNQSGQTCIAYCFASIKGFSHVDSYIGTAQIDGPFIYTGFRPAFIILKNSSVSNWWNMWDTKREPYNVADATLYPNVNNSEVASVVNWSIDILSNGFKVRTDNSETNSSTGVFCYYAIAEQTLVTTGNVPTTAR